MPDGTPKGRRRISPASLATERSAVTFAGLPSAVTNPAQLTETITSALRVMGVSSSAIDLARYLAKRIKKTDWQTTSRPVCWPASRTIENDLCITGRHRRRLQTELIEAGALIMADSNNMKRYGRRDPSGNIIAGQAFGYDLTSWATCYDTFAAIVADHAAHCARRHDAFSTAKRDKRKIDDLAKLEEGRADLAAFAKRAGLLWQDMETQHSIPDRSPEIRAEKTRQLESLAQRMELLRVEAVGTAAPAVQELGKDCDSSVHNQQKESAQADSDVHLKNTTINPQNNNFVQARRGSVAAGTDIAQPALTAPAASQASKEEPDAWRERAPWDGGELSMPQVRTTAAELADLVPQIKQRLEGEPATWGNVTTALRAYAHDFGISGHAIKQAERVMGWQSTYISLAIVASKAEGHFDVSPGAFFNGGMLKSAKRGELNLRDSLYGLRKGSPDAAAQHRPKRSSPEAPPTLAKPKAFAAAECARSEARSDREEIEAEKKIADSVKRSGAKGLQSTAATLSALALPVGVKRGINDGIKAARPAAMPASLTPEKVDEITHEIRATADKYAQGRALDDAAKHRFAGMIPDSPEWQTERSRLRREITQAIGAAYLPMWLR